MRRTALLLVSMLTFTAFVAFIRTPQVADGFIGDIKYSLLNPDQFARAYASQFGEEHKNDWVLLDGSNISETTLANYYTKENLPDARGLFLRGMNEGRRDGNQNPEEQVVGSLQGDQFLVHSHNVRDAGHHHGLKSTINEGHRSQGGAEASTLGGGYYMGQAKIEEDKVGGSETRPKNISVYIYIKIK